MPEFQTSDAQTISEILHAIKTG